MEENLLISMEVERRMKELKISTIMKKISHKAHKEKIEEKEIKIPKNRKVKKLIKV